MHPICIQFSIFANSKGVCFCENKEITNRIIEPFSRIGYGETEANATATNQRVVGSNPSRRATKIGL